MVEPELNQSESTLTSDWRNLWDHKTNGAESWSDLPPEILSSIGKRFETPLDVSLFRSVCKGWRSSLPAHPTSNPNPNSGILSPFLPLHIPNSSNLPFNNRPDESLILVASAVLHVQPIDSDPNSIGWLITVEERIAGKLRLLRPLSKSPLGIKLPSNFPNCISLFKFRVTEIAKGYSFKFASDGKDVSDIKVILCSTSIFNDCTAMVLYGNGVLVGVRVRNGEWGYVRESIFSPLVNLSSHESMVYAVDGRGDVYVVDHMLMKVTSTVVCGETGASWGKMLCKGIRSLKHHLLDSNGELYLVVWDYSWWKNSSGAVFEVYKLNKGQRKWVCVENFGGVMIFVSPDWCFLAFNHYRISGNAIVYSSRCLSTGYDVPASYSLFRARSIDLGGFHLFRAEKCDRDRVPTSLYEDMADMMWPPPTWFLPDTFSSTRDDEHEGQSDFCSQHSPTCIDEVPCASEDQDSRLKFEELCIGSDHVPILQKVWAKHGNILEGCNVHSKRMISCALESLAELIIILEGNTGRTLTEVQCNDITSILCDLKHLNLRVEWLSPFVEKAVALHISKPMIAALAELDKAIARATEMKMKVSNDLANMDELVKELEKDRIRLFERMPISGSVDLDQCLAKRLF